MFPVLHTKNFKSCKHTADRYGKNPSLPHLSLDDDQLMVDRLKYYKMQ